MGKTFTAYELLGKEFAWIPIACLVVLALAYVIHAIVRYRNHEKALPIGTLFWLLPFVGLLIFFEEWYSQGLMDVPDPWLFDAPVIIAVAGFAVLARDYTIDSFSETGLSETTPQHSAENQRSYRKTGLRGVRNLIILAVAVAAAYFALYLPWIVSFDEMKIECILFERGLIALLLVALYFLSQHTGVAPAFGVAAFALLGLADHFVYQFRGIDLKPSDLLSLNTAAAVAGNYDYALDLSALWGILCAAFGIMLLAHISPGRGATIKKGWKGFVRSTIIGCLLLGSLVGFCTQVSFDKDLGIDYHDWSPRENYNVKGFLPAFIAGAQSLQIIEPTDYSREKADELLIQYAKYYDDNMAEDSDDVSWSRFGEVKTPSIIVVMNETFADLGALYDGLHDDYEGPSFFNNGLDDALMRGSLGVPVLGGRTCNTEFEFLTGISNQFVTPSAEPFTLFDCSDAPSMVKQLESDGYSSFAIHPNRGANWKRDQVYAQLGFDEFLTISDFDGDAEEFHNGIADFETYDMALEILAEHDEPVFIFDVTMQNHGGYANNDIPDDLLTDYEPSGSSTYWNVAIDDMSNAQLNEYLSCIEASDRDLEYLIERLRYLNEPVVVIFFGDHQPSIASTYNYAWASEDDTRLSREYLLYQTQYVVWTNYSTGQGETVVQNTSSDSLAALAFEQVGLPLTDLQKARLVIGETVDMITGGAFSTVDGALYENEVGQVQEYDDLALLDYRYFGDAGE